MVEITAGPATQKDATDILMLLTEQHAEMKGLLPPMDNAVVLLHIKQLIDHGFVAVARTPDGTLAGSIGLGVDRWWFNRDYYYMADFWTFVSKRFRKTRAAAKLFATVKEFSDRSGIPIIMGIFTRDQQKRKNTLYRRQFDTMGEQFAYGLKNQMEQRRKDAA